MTDKPQKRHLPLTRGECKDGPRPCPYVSCRHHLLGLGDRGLVTPRSESMKVDPDELADRALALPMTCSLDVAEDGPHILEAVGAVMRMTRERVRQIEESASAKVRDNKLAISIVTDAAAAPTAPQPEPPRPRLHRPKMVIPPRPRRPSVPLPPGALEERKRMAIALWRKGYCPTEIAIKMALCPSEISRILRAAGLSSRKGPPALVGRNQALAMMAQGLGNVEIGRRLGINPGTISAWRRRAKRASHG